MNARKSISRSSFQQQAIHKVTDFPVTTELVIITLPKELHEIVMNRNAQKKIIQTGQSQRIKSQTKRGHDSTNNNFFQKQSGSSKNSNTTHNRQWRREERKNQYLHVVSTNRRCPNLYKIIPSAIIFQSAPRI